MIRNIVADCTGSGDTVLIWQQSETVLIATLDLVTLALVWLAMKNIVAGCTSPKMISLMWQH